MTMGSIEEEYAEAVTKGRIFITTHLTQENVEGIMDHLLGRSIISMAEADDVRLGGTTARKASTLVDMMLKKGTEVANFTAIF